MGRLRGPNSEGNSREQHVQSPGSGRRGHALTAGIGLIPLVVGGKKPGLEILYPVATVILGGLMTSTFCEFLIHPGLFWKFSGKDAEKLTRTEGSDAELLRAAA